VGTPTAGDENAGIAVYGNNVAVLMYESGELLGRFHNGTSWSSALSFPSPEFYWHQGGNRPAELNGKAWVLGVSAPNLSTEDVTVTAFSFASLLNDYSLTADPGAFTVTGTAASLEKGFRLSADSGSVTWTGTAATLRVTRKLTAESGAFTWTGTAADLAYGEGSSSEYTGEWVTQAEEPVLYASGTKLTHPEARLRPNWTTAHVLSADDANAIKDALMDIRVMLRRVLEELDML
jgi:hypothetical protein